MKPFLKWAGGKQNLIKHLIPFVPEDYQERTYFEPFLGAGTMFFELSPKRAVLSDLNPHLMNCIEMVRKNPRRMHSYLLVHKRKSCEDYYYKVRRLFNKKIDSCSTAQAARFVYLNKTCFNGIFRVNKSGLFNVPYGYRDRAAIPSLGDLLAPSRRLKRAKLLCFSYENVITLVDEDSFVYIDPPYPPIGENSSFNHYTAKRFGKLDQERLAEFAGQLDSLGCSVMISNADTKTMRQLYSGWFISSTEVTRYITCKSEKHRVKELVITNYKPKHM